MNSSLDLFQNDVLNHSKLKKFADDNFEFKKKMTKFSQREGAIFPSPTMFLKDLYDRHIKEVLVCENILDVYTSYLYKAHAFMLRGINVLFNKSVHFLIISCG